MLKGGEMIEEKRLEIQKMLDIKKKVKINNIMKTAMEKLEDYFINSPKETQEFIMSKRLQKEFVDLEKKFKLTNEETKILQEGSIEALLSMIDKESFVKEAILALRNRSAAETEKIINEIKDKILTHA